MDVSDNSNGPVRLEMQKIIQLFNELDLFSAEAAQLDTLLTMELGSFWRGPAYEACRMESRDNREIMLEAIGRYRSMLEEHFIKEIEPETLPSDILF